MTHIPESHLGREPDTGRRFRLLPQVRRRLRLLHYAPATERAYVDWVRRYVNFHGRKHPSLMGLREVNAFVAHLSNDRQASASTRSQALHALAFLYREVLRAPLDLRGDARAVAKVPPRLPLVLSHDDVRRLLDQLRGTKRLCALLMYGAGLRVGECVSLRVKDVDFDRGQLAVRGGPGGRERFVPLPVAAEVPLRALLERERVRWQREAHRVRVPLPGALAAKSPNAVREWQWRWVFAAARTQRTAEGEVRRWHLHPSVLQRAIPEAARAAGLHKRVTCNALRHSFATHLLEGGTELRIIQELLGHRELATTMAYARVVRRGALGVLSPADRL